MLDLPEAYRVKQPFDRQLTEASTRTPAEVMKPWLGKVHHGDCVELGCVDIQLNVAISHLTRFRTSAKGRCDR